MTRTERLTQDITTLQSHNENLTAQVRTLTQQLQRAQEEAVQTRADARIAADGRDNIRELCHHRNFTGFHPQREKMASAIPFAIAVVVIAAAVWMWSPWHTRPIISASVAHASPVVSHARSATQPILPVASASDEPLVVALASAEASDLTIATSTTPPMPIDEPRESLDVTIHRGLLQHGEVIQHALHQRLSALSQSPADNHAANAAYRRIRSKWQTIAQLYRTAASDDQAIVQQWAASLDEQFTEHPRFPSRYFIAKLN